MNKLYIAYFLLILFLILSIGLGIIILTKKNCGENFPQEKSKVVRRLERANEALNIYKGSRTYRNPEPPRIPRQQRRIPRAPTSEFSDDDLSLLTDLYGWAYPLVPAKLRKEWEEKEQRRLEDLEQELWDKELIIEGNPWAMLMLAD